MNSTESITDPFSRERRDMLMDLANVTITHDAESIGEAWGRHYKKLGGAGGIFVVDDPNRKLKLPGDHDFGSTGFLRCLMGSTCLLNIQNKEEAREFRYLSNKERVVG
jgi:hypothetical protein